MKITANNRSVLIVEDELAIQEAAKIKLQKVGIKVFTADNGREAITKIKENKPSLVWLDVRLPDINGIEVLRQVRQDKEFKNLPVIIVSVSEAPDTVKNALEMNVAGYFVKSDYRLTDLADKVKLFLDHLL